MAVDKQDKPATEGHSTAALISGADALVPSLVPAGSGWARYVPVDTATLSAERRALPPTLAEALPQPLAPGRLRFGTRGQCRKTIRIAA